MNKYFNLHLGVLVQHVLLVLDLQVAFRIHGLRAPFGCAFKYTLAL